MFLKRIFGSRRLAGWAAVVAGVAWGNAHAAADFSAWSDSIGIALRTDSAGGANVKNTLPFDSIPVLVRLNPGVFSGFANTRPGGADIRFAGLKKSSGFGTVTYSWTALPYQIEQWVDGAGDQDTAEIWVLVYGLKGNDSTQFIKMYWGNPSAADSSNGARVFSPKAGFMAVYHLGETAAATGTAGVYKDATGNGYDADDYIAGDPAPGMIGKGIALNGTDEYLVSTSFRDSAVCRHGTVPPTVSVSAWVLFNPTGRDEIVLANEKKDTAGFMLHKDAGNNPMMWAGAESAGVAISCWQYGWGQKLSPDAQTRVLFGGTFDSWAARSSVNGEGRNNSVDGRCDTAYVNSPNPLYIGRNASSAAGFLQGMIDEVRIENVLRPSGWMKVCYENQRPDQNLLHFAPIYQLNALVRNSRHRSGSGARPVLANALSADVTRMADGASAAMYDLRGRLLAPAAGRASRRAEVSGIVILAPAR